MRTAAAALLAALAFAAPAAAAPVEIRTLSNRADLVSGGDVLVQVSGPAGTRVQAGGRDVTSALSRRDGRLQGLVTGLPLGRSRIVARAPDGAGAVLTVTNHPRSGPVFAGPQTQPWVCLDGYTGADCGAPTTYKLVYKPDRPYLNGFADYDPANPPSDVAMTTTDQGRKVPFIVRVETGVMDRGVYSVAKLQDTWNGKVLWPFGGDCKPWHVQDTPVDPLGIYPLDPPAPFDTGVDEGLGSIFGNGNAVTALGKGFLVADSALNKLGSQCNSVVSAEAISMLKEHIAETYGPIRYTIGAGSSGGSMQQHQIAAEYPGLLDGIQPMASFPDNWETLQEAEDCHLLTHYFTSTSPQLWAAQPQRAAVLGDPVTGACTVWDRPAGGYAQVWMDPANASGCGIDAAQVYPNPGGVRCTLQDYMVSVFGRRAKDGFANRPFDNVGVQYGLDAVRSGKITAEQFVDLNEKVGGLDIDWGFQAGRSVADAPALDVAYRAGLVTGGRELAKVPIVDIRGQDDVEIHSDFHTWAMRDRLDRANGGHDSQVVFLGARPLIGDPGSFDEAFALVDRWLARIAADRSRRSPAEKVRLDKPADAVDTCWIEGRRVTDWSLCRAAYPYFGDPRIAAGGPLADDVLKCALRPLDREEYGVAFTDDQWARLRAAFPAGVCDYKRPGPGRRPSVPWMSFAAGPGGRPLGPPPRSRPLRP